MGRYRQWLHHQEIDQQLHTHLHQLETELSSLQQQATLYGNVKDTISTENQLFIALTASMYMNALPTVSSHRSDDFSLFSPTQSSPAASSESMPTIAFIETSSANADPSSIEETRSQLPSQTAIPNPPREELASSRPHAELALQPEDMMPSFDTQLPTEPQRELPRWLHSLIEASLQNNQGISAMNEESLRTNRLFQRWSERWGSPSWAPSTPNETVKRQTPRKEGDS